MSLQRREPSRLSPAPLALLATPPGFRRLGRGGPPTVLSWLDALALGATAAALAVAGLLLVLVPQRLAQRPGLEGVMTVHLARDGALRVWNQPIRPAQLQPLLRRAQLRSPTLRLRLLPEPGVSWGSVRLLVERLEAPGRELELQLP